MEPESAFPRSVFSSPGSSTLINVARVTHILSLIESRRFLEKKKNCSPILLGGSVASVSSNKIDTNYDLEEENSFVRKEFIDTNLI